MTDYASYIGSPAWRAKRRERLALDKGRCVVCKERAVNVHHITYERLGNEDARRDLVSVCRACHQRLDAIERAERRERRSNQRGDRMSSTGKPGIFRRWLERRALVLVALAVLLALLLAMAAVQAAQARTPGAFSGGPQMEQAAQRLPSGWRYAAPDSRKGCAFCGYGFTPRSGRR